MEPNANPPDLAGTAPRLGKLIVILYADMEGYSRLIGRDDIGTVSRLRALRQTLIEPAILSHGGRIAQTGGDSLLVVFESIDGAVQCAIKIQREIPVLDGDQPPERQIRFRIGINIGDAIADGGDLPGDAVNVAARLQAICPVGCICVSRAVRDPVRDRSNLHFEDLGAVSLKNIAHPVEAFVLRPDAATAASGPVPAVAPALTRAPQTKLQRLSVMVVPLRNLGVPEAHAYLLEGIAEDIATDLSQYPGPLVVDWPKGASANPRDIARDLGVLYLIQGSVRGTADGLLVNLQLIDVETGVRLWAERFDINLGGATDVRNGATDRVGLTLFERLVEDVGRRVEARPRADWDTDDLIMRGLALVYRPAIVQNSPASNRREALHCFEQALVQTPDSLVAKVGVASVLILSIAVGESLSGISDALRAEQLLTDVLRIDGRIAYAHFWLGMLRQLQFRLHDSLSELQVALELAPKHAAAIANLGVAYVLLGQVDAAIPLLEKSLRLSAHDAHAPIAHGYLGLCHLLHGRNEQAVTSLRTARAMNAGMYFIPALLAAALALKGELAEAGTNLRQALELRPDLAGQLVAFLARVSPAFVALYERTVYAGLRRAGLPDIWGDSNERPPGWTGSAVSC